MRIELQKRQEKNQCGKFATSEFLAMTMRLFTAIILCLLQITASDAALITIDSSLPSSADSTGSRTTGAPFYSIAGAWGTNYTGIQSGDVVHLVGGKNGAVNHYTMPIPSVGYFCQGPTQLFSSWTFFYGDSAASTVIDNAIQIGADGGQYQGYNAYLAFNGVTFADGILAYGPNHVHISNCKFTRQGPLLGDNPAGGDYNEETTGLNCSGWYWTVDGCEITQCGDGIVTSCHYSQFINNTIHDVLQDGFHFSGAAANDLFQGNTITGEGEGDFVPYPITIFGRTYTQPPYYFSDGTQAYAGQTGAIARDWARHCDGIQFEMTGDNAASEDAFIVIRGNKIYFPERSCIQLNNHTAASPWHIHDLLIENNIFGADVSTDPILNFNPVDNLTIRYNTVVMSTTTSGLNYANLIETAQGTNGGFSFGGGANVSIYNNILGNGTIQAGGNVVRADHNVVQYPSGATPDAGAIAYGSRKLTATQSANPQNIDGIPIAGSPVIGGGTRLDPTGSFVVPWLPTHDFYGNVRGPKSDIGAVETPGQSQTAETAQAIITPSNPTTYTTGIFALGSLYQDPTLNTSSQLAIAWSDPGGYYIQNNSSGSSASNATNQMSESQAAVTTTPLVALITNVPQLTNFTYSYTAEATTNQNGGGPTWWYQDATDYFVLNYTGSGAPQFVQVSGGASTTLATLTTAFGLGANVTKSFAIAVAPTTGGVNVTFTVGGANATTVFVASSALPAAGSGWNFGLIRTCTANNYRLQYNTISITNNAP